MNESSNPYEATFLEEEKPPKELRFFRVTPKPNDVTGEMIRRNVWKTFLPKRWQFIGLGLLQLVLICLPMIPVALAELLYVSSYRFDNSVYGGPLLWLIEEGMIMLAAIAFGIWGCMTCVMTARWSLRLARGEKIFHRPTRQSVFRLFMTTLHCILYVLLCGLMLLPLYVLLLAGNVAFDELRGVSALIVGVAFVLGMLAFLVLGVLIFGRYVIGLSYIVDRDVGCLKAMRRTARFTRGNSLTIFASFLIHYVLLGFFGAITLYVGLLVMPGYLHCWLAVTYLLTTGQYDKPTAPETTEW